MPVFKIQIHMCLLFLGHPVYSLFRCKIHSRKFSSKMDSYEKEKKNTLVTFRRANVWLYAVAGVSQEFPSCDFL